MYLEREWRENREKRQESLPFAHRLKIKNLREIFLKRRSRLIGFRTQTELCVRRTLQGSLWLLRGWERAPASVHLIKSEACFPRGPVASLDFINLPRLGGVANFWPLPLMEPVIALAMFQRLFWLDLPTAAVPARCTDRLPELRITSVVTQNRDGVVGLHIFAFDCLCLRICQCTHL